MKDKLFVNLKKMTYIFSIAIMVVTVTILILRLTVFSDPASAPVSNNKTGSSSSGGVKGKTDGDFVFEYEIAEKMSFKNFEATANSGIKSSKSNTAYMQVKIIRNDNKRSVFESEYLKPGVNRTNINLQGSYLPKGVYECTAEIIALDSTNQEPVETFTAPVVIEILEDIEGMSPDDVEGETPASGEDSGSGEDSEGTAGEDSSTGEGTAE